jgi:hypothetical protein
MSDAQVFSAMQTGNPFRTYKKTILGKVYVKILDPFRAESGAQADLILSGDPKKNHEGCFIDVWTEKEDVYLRRMNAPHFKEGILIPFDRSKNPAESNVNPYNVMTDEELFELLNSPFFKLQNAYNKMTSQAPVLRLLDMAEHEEKSEKIINALRGRLSELQKVELES